MKVNLQLVDNVLVHMNHETQKKCIIYVRREISTYIDHVTYDRNCPSYETEKTRLGTQYSAYLCQRHICQRIWN